MPVTLFRLPSTEDIIAKALCNAITLGKLSRIQKLTQPERNRELNEAQRQSFQRLDWGKVFTHCDHNPLLAAVIENNPRLLNFLLKHKSADVSQEVTYSPKAADGSRNFYQRHSTSLLHIACEEGYAAIVDTLLDHGANPAQQNELKETALDLAKKHPEIHAKLLVAQKAAPSR